MSPVAPLHVEVGGSVLEGRLQASMLEARRRVVRELGLVLEDIPLRLNPALEPEGYRILVGGHETARGSQADLLGSHLYQVVRMCSHRLLTVEQVEGLLDRLAWVNPRLVERTRRIMSAWELTVVLRELLFMDRSIRDVAPLLEGILERAGHEPRELAYGLAPRCRKCAIA